MPPLWGVAIFATLIYTVGFVVGWSGRGIGAHPIPPVAGFWLGLWATTAVVYGVAYVRNHWRITRV
jgi:hypothetical protein